MSCSPLLWAFGFFRALKVALLIREFQTVQDAAVGVIASLLQSKYNEIEMRILVVVCYVSCILTAYLNERSNRALFCIRLGLSYKRDALLEDRDVLQYVRRQGPLIRVLVKNVLDLPRVWVVWD